MNEFEDFDPELADALRRRAGAGSTSIASAHDAVLRRAGHIRRRRAAAIGGLAMIGLIVGGFAVLPRGADRTLAPGDTGDRLAPVDSTIASSQLATSIGDNREPVGTDLGATTSTSPSATTATSTASTISGAGGTGTTIGGGAPSTTVSSATTTPRSGATSTTGGVSSTSAAPNTTVGGNSTSTSTAAQPQIQPFTKTYPSMGGSITVNWNGSALTLLTVSPASGFEAEIEDNQALRIRVRFRSDGDDSRIEIRISDGQLIETIS